MSSLKKYRKVKYLGKGSYGAALLVELRSDPSQKFVIKEIVIGHLSPAEQQAARNEAEVLHQMNHSNITMYIESFVENSKLYIVMEHADGGDLSNAIQKRKSENKFYVEEEIMRIFVQICLALRHVHNANILHRDLKSQNIFLTQKGMVKLGDFGIAKVLDASDDQARTQIGTPYYLSPEICESKPYGRSSDVWSLGVVLFELLALEMPFQANSLPALVHRICTAEPNYNSLESRYSPSLISLCKSLLMKNPDLRPTLNQIVKSDLFKNHISRLLSYTLKSGTGGVSEALKEIDPDEVDKNIEQIRNRERELLKIRDQESKDAAIQKDRQLQREDEKEKLRKYRQDMMARNNSQRPLSPKSQRPSPAPVATNQREPSKPNPFQRQNSPMGNKSRIFADYQTDRSNNNNYNIREQPSMVVTKQDASVVQDAARREFFANRAAAQAIKAKCEALERGSNQSNPNQPRRPSDTDLPTEINMKDMDPATRIAVLKSQREKEKEKENAAKEMQWKQAMEINREERRRLSDRQKAIAFDIDFNGNANDDIQVKVNNKSRVEDPDTPPRDNSNRKPQAAIIDIPVNDNNQQKKKGWGPPIDGNDILQARANVRRDSGINEQLETIEDCLSPTNEEIDQGKEVLKRIASKRQSQIEARFQAKEVLSKLREKRMRDARVKSERDVGKIRTQHDIVSPTKRVTNQSDSKPSQVSRSGSPMRARLMEIMNKVDIANDSVQKAIGLNNNNTRAESKESRNSFSSGEKDSRSTSRGNSNDTKLQDEEIRQVRELDQRFPYSDENRNKNGDAEDDLEDTLAVWLTEQQRSVTTRKKPSQMRKYSFSDNKAIEDDLFVADGNQADIVDEADDLMMYASKQINVQHNIEEDIPEEYDINRPLKGKFMGDDVEVIGMQCMLAKALMGDDSDDD